MNREAIIRMALEASNTPIDHHATPDLFGVSQSERFAALVAAAKEAEIMDRLTIAYMDGYEKGKDVGAAAEREACAKVVEASPSYDWHRFACEAAAAIRARGQA